MCLYHQLSLIQVKYRTGKLIHGWSFFFFLRLDFHLNYLSEQGRFIRHVLFSIVSVLQWKFLSVSYSATLVSSVSWSYLL